MSPESIYYKKIIAKLDGVNKRENLLRILIGIQICVILLIGGFVSFAIIEDIFNASSLIRTILISILLIVLSAALVYYFLIPLLKYLNIIRKNNYFKIAERIGNHFEEIKDDLINAIQIVTNPDNVKNYSLPLIEASFKNVYFRTENINFSSIINLASAKKISIYLLGIIIISTILLISFPSLNLASYRLIHFNREFVSPPKFIFEVSPGNAKVTKGENISIYVKIVGMAPKNIYLFTKDIDQTNFEPQQLYADKKGEYHYVFPAVRNSFKYYVHAENINSIKYLISVEDRPVIKTLDLIVISPAYSKLGEVHQKDNGNITALLGSYAYLNVLSTKKIKSSDLEFDDSTRISLKSHENETTGKFRISKDNNYKIILTDEDGNHNISPIDYNIKVLYDAYPNIEIISPNKNVDLSNDNRLPIDLKISDDYGFTKLLLKFNRSDNKNDKSENASKSIEIPINKNQTEQEINYIWNLTDLNLSAGDIITYFLEIYDNDNISGPKSTKSSSFSIRVPSLNELLTKADKTQNESEQDLNKTLQDAKDLKDKMNSLSQELKQDKKDLSWQEKQKVEQAINQFKELQKKAEDIGTKINKIQQMLQQNNLISKETLQKYMDLQKLFDQISNDELKKAFEKLQDVLQNMNRKETQDAVENMKFNEDQFKNSIERTMNLLKRIQIEQKMDDLKMRTDQITKDQNNLKNNINKNNAQDEESKNQLSQKQDNISKDLKDYADQLNELSKMMDALKDMPKEQLKDLRDQFNKQQNQNASQQASQDIKQGNMEQAGNNQSRISQNMQEMKKQIDQLQKSLDQQSQMQAFKEMMKITDNLLTLSKQQEELEKQSSDLNQNSSSFDENARKQNEIQRNLDKLMQQMSSLSQKTFAITPQMGKALGDAQKEMRNSMQGLQNRNGMQSASSQGKAMASLNQAASMMKNSMESMMKGGGQGSGMMSLMQQLQQMAGNQMSLNNLTQMLQKQMNGNLSMQQQAELKRLAQQQDLIRKSLEQLNKEAMKSGESNKIPANLEDIAKKMQEIVKNLDSKNLNDNTVQQQEHILSRLLDAQKSINERDYENKRESTPGQDITRNSPADLKLNQKQNTNKIKDELDKASSEGYNKDYEDLIKKYYEALQKQNGKN